MVYEWFEHLFVVEERVNQVGIVFYLIDDARVDDLQDHS